MHPHFPYSHGFHSWHGGPRRLVWFVLGAASATMWIHHKEAHRQTHERYFGHCFRPPVASMRPDLLPPDEAAQWRARDISAAINKIPAAPAPAPTPASSPLPWGYSEAHQDRQWEEEKLKLQAIGKQAENVMAKLSEDALDTVMIAMEALKAKLAQHREQREQAQRQLEKQLEEQKNNPHRFV